jgi:nicotinamide-nucleotide amidase
MTGGRAELRRAEIIAVGSEMLTPDRSDTNSLYVTARLNELGIDVGAKAVVGDHLETLASVFAAAFDRSDLVVMTGGLGPTDDDLTRLAVARVLGRRMSEDATTVERIRARFARRGWPMPEINRRQAQVIDGAALLDNRHGTAPGQWLEVGDRVVVLLPGPPRELRPMIDLLCRGASRRPGGPPAAVAPHGRHRRAVGVACRGGAEAALRRVERGTTLLSRRRFSRRSG